MRHPNGKWGMTLEKEKEMTNKMIPREAVEDILIRTLATRMLRGNANRDLANSLSLIIASLAVTLALEPEELEQYIPRAENLIDTAIAMAKEQENATVQ